MNDKNIKLPHIGKRPKSSYLRKLKHRRSLKHYPRKK